MHTCTHIHITYIHKYIHLDRPTDHRQMDGRAYMYTCIYVYVHTYIHICIGLNLHTITVLPSFLPSLTFFPSFTHLPSPSFTHLPSFTHSLTFLHLPSFLYLPSLTHSPSFLPSFTRSPSVLPSFLLPCLLPSFPPSSPSFLQAGRRLSGGAVIDLRHQHYRVSKVRFFLFYISCRHLIPLSFPYAASLSHISVQNAQSVRIFQ